MLKNIILLIIMSQSEWKVFKSNKKSELLWDFNDNSKYCDNEGNCKGFIFIPYSNCHSGINFRSFSVRGDFRNTSNNECIMRCTRDPLCEHAIIGTGAANGYCHLNRVSRDAWNRGFLDSVRSGYDKTTMKADRSVCRRIGGSANRYHTYVKEKRGSIQIDTLHERVTSNNDINMPGAASGFIHMKELEWGAGSIQNDENMGQAGGRTLEECRMDCLGDSRCVWFMYNEKKQYCKLRRHSGTTRFEPTKMSKKTSFNGDAFYFKLAHRDADWHQDFSFNGYNLLRADKDSGYNCEDHEHKYIGDMPFYKCARKCDLDASCRAWSTNMANPYSIHGKTYVPKSGTDTSCTHIYDKDINNRKTEKAFLGACKPIKLDDSNKQNKHLFTYFKELRIAPLTQMVKVLPEPTDNTPASAKPEPDDLITSKSQAKTADGDTDTVESSSDEESPHTHDFTHNHDLTHQHEFIHHHDDKYQTLGNYVTHSDLTAELALKSDKPADGETYALDSTLTNNYKTATESDALYATKTELDDYKTANDANIKSETDNIKSTLTNDYNTKTASDALYATKTELDNYKTANEANIEAQTDALETTLTNDYITKTASDNRYLQSDDLIPYAKKTDYYDKTASDGRYVQPYPLNHYANETD